MADQVEEIRLEINPGDAKAGADAANAALDGVEKKAASVSASATKATSDAATSIVSITSRSQTSIQRLVEQAERKASGAGATKIQQLAAQGNQTIDRVAGDPRAVERVTAAYQKLIETQREADKEPGFIKSILQVGIFLEIAQKAVAVIKDLTVGTALYSARTDQLGIALGTVAKSNGISAGSTATLEKQINSLGVTTQTTRQNLTQLIVAQVDYTKAVKLASLAQNIGRISGEGTAEAFDKIKLAIVGGNERVVRSIGLNVSFQNSYEKVAKATNRAAADLSEYEKIQIRTDALIEGGVAANGVYAASLDTVSGRLLSLERKANDAKDALGSQFQGEAAITLSGLEKLAATVSKYPGLFGNLVRGALGAAGALALVFGGPIVATIGGVTAAIALVSHVINQVKEAYEAAKIAKDTFFGKSAADAAEEKSLFGSVASAKFAESNLKLRKQAEDQIDAQKIRSGQITDEARKRSVVVEREAAAERLQALSSEAGGVRAVLLERQKSLNAKSTFLDASGIERTFKLSAKTIEDVNATTNAKLAIENRKTEEQIRQERNKTSDLIQENEKHNVQSRADLELQQWENVLAREVLDRRTVEDQRLALHKDTIDRIAAIDRKLIEDQGSREIAKLQADEKRKGTSAGKIAQLTDGLQKQTAERVAQIDRATADAKERAERDLQTARIQRDRDFADRRQDFEFETSQKVLENQRHGLDQSKDLQLEQLGLVQNQSIASKLATEQARLAIQIDFLKRSSAIEKSELDARFARDFDKLLEEESRTGISHEETLRKLLDLDVRYSIEKGKINKDTNASIELAQTRTAVQQGQILQDHYKSVYDSIKQSAGGVFDQLFTKSQNIFQAIGNVFKTAMLTALKEVVTSRIAAAFTQLLTGAKVGFAPAGLPGQGGILGKLGGILGIGATPTFQTPPFVNGPNRQNAPLSKLEQPGHIGDAQLTSGALKVYVINEQTGQTARQEQIAPNAILKAAGLGGVFAGLGGLASLGGGARAATSVGSTISFPGIGGSITGAPTITAGTAGTSGAAGSLGGIAGIFGGLKSSVGGFLTQLGGIGATSKLFSKGIYGSTGGALLAGGGILAADGLRRGGLTGLAETTAGGALIGAKFGGPIGALIGGAIGLGAGAIRLFVKGANEKIIQKVKDLYGINIDKGIVGQIQSLAKSSFGGNIDTTIRSAQIRDLLELYAQSTGQSFGGSVAKATSLSLIQSGGQLFQAPNYSNGSALPSLGGSIPSLGISGAAQQSTGATPYAIQVQASPEQVADFLRAGTLNVVASSGRAVSAAVLQGSQANSARRETVAAQTEPGLLVS